MSGRYRVAMPLLGGLLLPMACIGSDSGQASGTSGQEFETTSVVGSADSSLTSESAGFLTASEVPSRVSCLETGCTIVLERVASLSDSASPGMFGNRIFVDRDAAGNFLSTSLSFDHFLTFDSSGRLLRIMGGRGEGPNEYQRGYVPIRGPFDSLFIADMANARLSILSPEGQYTRSVPFQYVPDLILADGTFVVAASLAGPSAAGYPVHHVAKNGTLLRSFGVDTPEYRADMRRLFTRVVGPGGGGTVWMTPPGQYRLEEWDVASGQLLRAVPRVGSDWFVESPRPGGSPTSVRPDPVISQVWEGSEGLVWVFATVPDPKWQPLFSGRSPDRGLTHSERSSVYDWRLEVVDPQTGAVVASHQFDEEVWIRYPYQYFIKPAGVRGGGVVFDLLQPRLGVARRESP